MMIKTKYLELLSRPTRTIVHFNDVFFEHEVDFDAELTVMFRNLAKFSSLMFPIGKYPKIADYGIVLLDDLIEEERRIIEKIRGFGTDAAKNIFSGRLKKQVVSIVNCAPRNDETTQNGMNGEDFHLAITDNGLEIYVVPLERLQGLETRNRILALYRIPNESLVSTDGKREQFRSSIITTARYFPDTLVPVFEYETIDELMAAKESGTHPNVIATQEKLAELAFIDKFGNVRISVKDCNLFTAAISSASFGDKIAISIGASKPLIVNYVTSLKEIPTGEVGFYQNVADQTSAWSNAGYFEIVKKSSNPNREDEPASKILENLNENFVKEEYKVELV